MEHYTSVWQCFMHLSAPEANLNVQFFIKTRSIFLLAPQI